MKRDEVELIADLFGLWNVTKIYSVDDALKIVSNLNIDTKEKMKRIALLSHLLKNEKENIDEIFFREQLYLKRIETDQKLFKKFSRIERMNSYKTFLSGIYLFNLLIDYSHFIASSISSTVLLLSREFFLNYPIEYLENKGGIGKYLVKLEKTLYKIHLSLSYFIFLLIEAFIGRGINFYPTSSLSFDFGLGLLPVSVSIPIVLYWIYFIPTAKSIVNKFTKEGEKGLKIGNRYLNKIKRFLYTWRLPIFRNNYVDFYNLKINKVVDENYVKRFYENYPNLRVMIDNYIISPTANGWFIPIQVFVDKDRNLIFTCQKDLSDMYLIALNEYKDLKIVRKGNKLDGYLNNERSLKLLENKGNYVEGELVDRLYDLLKKDKLDGKFVNNEFKYYYPIVVISKYLNERELEFILNHELMHYKIWNQ
ncbi:MAG: hypothetical protein QW641_02825 [Candidatus Aenigmatarchaeota archaeon]